MNEISNPMQVIMQEIRSLREEMAELKANNGGRPAPVGSEKPTGKPRELRKRVAGITRFEERPVIFYGHEIGKEFNPDKLLSWVRYIDARYFRGVDSDKDAYDIVNLCTRENGRDFLVDNFDGAYEWSWKDIRTAYITSFITSNYGLELKEQLHLARQGNGKISDYNLNVRSILQRYKKFADAMISTGESPYRYEWRESDIIREYTSGLRKEYRDGIALQQKSSITIDEALDQMVHRETFLAEGKGKYADIRQAEGIKQKDNKGRKQEPPVPYYNASPRVRDKNGAAPMEADQLATWRTRRWSDEKYEELKKDKGCFKCGELGHISYDCPKKREQSSSRDTKEISPNITHATVQDTDTEHGERDNKSKTDMFGLLKSDSRKDSDMVSTETAAVDWTLEASDDSDIGEIDFPHMAVISTNLTMKDSFDRVFLDPINLKKNTDNSKTLQNINIKKNIETQDEKVVRAPSVPCASFKVPVKVYDRLVVGSVSTGAESNFINSDLVPQEHRILCDAVTVTCAYNDERQTEYKAIIDVEINNCVFSAEFALVDELPKPLYLGMPFLMEHHKCVDLGARTIVGVNIPNRYGQ